MTLDKILFAALLISPIIALIVLAGNFFSNKKSTTNEAHFYSFWLLVFIFGIFFFLYGVLYGDPSEYKVGLNTVWNFLKSSEGKLVKATFVISAVWSYLKINSSLEKAVEDEVAKFLLSVVIPTAIAVTVWLFVMPVVTYAQ